MQAVDIAFIGGGNMARSLIGGLIADGTDCRRITVAEPREDTREALTKEFGVNVTADNAEAAASAGLVILAVKPQVMSQVCHSIAAAVQAGKPLVLSIAAGTRTDALARWLGGEPALVRAMPNTPALIGTGASALFANDRATETQRELAESILRAVGTVVWLNDEALMDAVTAVSGSGPAYFFLVIEVLQRAAERQGLPSDVAALLATQTGFGAAKMALESSEDAATLRQRVTSPGGTTEAALSVLEEADLGETFARAVSAATERGRELARMLGEQE